MPTKKPTLFDETFDEPVKEKRPTLLQYIKSTKDIEYPLLSRIELVWFPGKFNNYTLETPLFRCQVSDKNPLYTLLEKMGYKVFKDSESAILLRVMDERARIQLAESNVYGKYSDIGNIGIKFQPTDGAN